MFGREVLKKSFPVTVPVLAGYLTLGMAFGLLLQQTGYNVLWALFMSLAVYAGSAQFLAVGLLAAGASLAQTAILTLVLNFRHFFYGFSMITKYRDTGKRKWYLIFGLTDETYAILSSTEVPKGVADRDFYFCVTFLDQCYWILGSVTGSLFGSVINMDLTGLDFAMTALFAVLVVEQWKNNEDKRPALIGFGIIVVSLILFGPDRFLIPGLIAISAVLLIYDGIKSRERKEGLNEQ